MDISTQTFRESYTDYYNQKILANENADENDWRSMSDKQWDKMLDGIVHHTAASLLSHFQS